jgi:hypothetical protein
MIRIRLALLALAAAGTISSPATSQPPASSRARVSSSVPAKGGDPKLVPVAETKIVMEGIAHANFQGLERILQSREIDAESWGFARGQALLIAETGNLLMIRPPRNAGEEAWLRIAGELRDSASGLAKTVASRDLERSRAGLIQLAGTCNRCHQTFRVQTRITAFEPAKP